MYLHQYPFSLLVCVRNLSFMTGWANEGEKTTVLMDLEIVFTWENI